MAHDLRRFAVDRWHVLRRVYWRPLVAKVMLTYAAAEALSVFTDQLASSRLQKDLRLGNHIPHLSGWQWAVIGLGLLLILGVDGAAREFRRDEDRHKAALNAVHEAHDATKAALQVEQERPVSLAHRDQLRGMAQHALAMIRSGRACQYFSGRLRGPDAKSVFASHFSAATAFLDRWDDALKVKTDAQVALLERVGADLHELMSSAPWKPEEIRKVFQVHLEQCAKASESGEQEPALEISIKHDAGFWHRRHDISSTDLHYDIPTAYSPLSLDNEIFDSKDAEENANHYKDKFSEWFEAIRMSPEFGALRSAWPIAAEARRHALEAVQNIALKDVIYGRCGMCAP